MLTREDDVDAHTLHAKGWTISAIARHLGHDRKTIRAYLTGERVAGRAARPAEDPFDRVRRLCAGPADARIRICGPRRCLMSSRRSGSSRAIRP